MLAQNKFNRLDIKQKIYKIAYAIREQEERVKSGKPAEFFVIDSYLEYIQKERNIKRVHAFLEKTETALPKIKAEENASVQAGLLNFYFHDILEILGEPVGEKFYQVKLFDATHPTVRYDTVALLDNIRSAFNVGNIFRSADSFGVGKLALCGITPHPPSMKIERTAMGTVDVVEWEYFSSTIEAITYYKEAGYRIYGLETVENSVSVDAVKSFEKTAFVFGNEEFGITDEVLSHCHDVIEIPLVGMKNSINVSNVFAIMMYEIMKSQLR